MNAVVIISSLVAIVLLIVAFTLANKIANRWLRYLAIPIGIIVAFGVATSIPPLLGDPEPATSAKVGEMSLYLGIGLLVLKSLFFKKR